METEMIRKKKVRGGVVWDILSQQWDGMYIFLIQYEQREGQYNIPYKHKEDGQTLGIWLRVQRTANKNRNIDATKEKKMEELGVVWDVYAQQWEDMYMLILQYEQREGHCDVPWKHKEGGQNLGHWLSSQRNDKKTCKLDDDRLRRLEEIGIEWNPPQGGK